MWMNIRLLEVSHFVSTSETLSGFLRTVTEGLLGQCAPDMVFICETLGLFPPEK